MNEAEKFLTSNSENDPSLQKAIRAKLRDKLKGEWQDALENPIYEVAASALKDATSTLEWRRSAGDPTLRNFYDLFEGLSRIRKDSSYDEMRELIPVFLANLQGTGRSSPHLHDFFEALSAYFEGTEYKPKFDITTQKVTELLRNGDLSILSDPDIPIEAKLDRMKKRIDGYVRGARALDETKKEVREKAPDESNVPPPDEEELAPSMDEMERAESGEQVPAMWSIDPAYGGYYKEKSFDTWDSERNVWKQSEYQYQEVPDINTFKKGDEIPIEMLSHIPQNQWTRIPIPYTHVIRAIEFKGKYEIKMDQNGDYLIKLNGRSDNPITFKLEAYQGRNTVPEDYVPPSSMKEVLISPDTEKTLGEIENTKRGNYLKAKAISRHVMKILTYSQDSSCNSLYRSDPEGYIRAIEKNGKADCDVGNTYFAALCNKLSIPVRMCIGHMVTGKDQKGKSRITSGTGHAWCEIFDDQTRQWVRIDATPAGDPIFEDQQKSEHLPGDYGEREAIGPTDEELEKLRQELEKHAEELSYTEEEHKLSEETGIELKEAREVMKEINEAENSRLPSGEKITHVLSSVFSMIVESRKIHFEMNQGPARRSEGGEEIDEIIRHYIGLKAGESDPASRAVVTEIVEEEKDFGGLDFFFVGDKSGSMSDTVDGEKKWKMQRKAAYLILSALHRFDLSLKRALPVLDKPLSTRSEMISFRDSSTIDEDKPLSSEFKSEDKVKLWKSLGNQGSGNGDVASLKRIYEEIKKEVEENKKKGMVDDKLRIVVAMSDGAPDSASGVQNMARLLGELNAVVVGLGLTETASTVPVIFDTPVSRGEVVKDINDLPAVTAKHIVLEAIKLFPQKARDQAAKDLSILLRKFPQKA